MNRFCSEKYLTKAWKHAAAPHMAVTAGYRLGFTGSTRHLDAGVTGPVGRTIQSLLSGKGDQGQIVGAIQITPIKPIPSDKMVRVEVSPVCI